MTPTLSTPDPAVFSEDVRRFAAERGVTEYLIPLYELTRRCFDGVEVTVTQENDYEIPDLGWIIFDTAVADWDFDRYRAAKDRWIEEFLRSVPPAARQPFILGM